MIKIENKQIGIRGNGVVIDGFTQKNNLFEERYKVNRFSSIGAKTGGLRIEYRLPSLRYLGKENHLSLVYDSLTVAPHPALAFRLSLEDQIDDNNLDLISTLTVNGHPAQEFSLDGKSGIIHAHFIYDAGHLDTGIYKFDVSIRDKKDHFSGKLNDNFIVFNRSQSAFGSGWGLKGLQRIFVSDNDQILWTDGSGMYTTCTFDQNRFTILPDFSKLIKNSDQTFSRVEKSGVKHMFDAKGFHLVTEDRNGNRMVYLYDSNNFLHTIIDPVGGQTIFKYDSSGYLSQIEDSAGRTTKVEVSPSTGSLISITDARGCEQRFQFNTDSIEITNPKGFITHYQKDSLTRHRVSQVMFPDGGTLIFQPSDLQGTDNSHKAIKFNLPLVTDSLLQDVIIDQNSNKTIYKTDKNGQILLKVDPMGHKTKVTRDKITNRPIELEDAQEILTKIKYDLRGNTIEIARNEYITRFTYHPELDMILEKADKKGNITKYDYDTHGNLISVANALGVKVIQNTYNKNGTLSKVVAGSNTIRYIQNSRGNVAKRTDAAGNETQYEYDEAGNILSIQDALGRMTRYEYCPTGCLTSVTDALGYKTSYSYDTNGNLTLIRDAKGAVTLFGYDHNNRLFSVQYPTGKITKLSYDKSGRMISVKDRKGQNISYEYDPLGRIIKKITGDNEFNFAYDSIGNLILAENKQSRVEMNYDDLGRLLQVMTVSKDKRKSQVSATIKYQYGLLKSPSVLIYPDGKKRTYSYNKSGNLKKIEDPCFGIFELIYNEHGGRENMIFPSGNMIKYSYTQTSQISALELISSQHHEELLDSIKYVYDAVNNITAIEEKDDQRLLKYDELNRLESVILSSDQNRIIEAYQFDEVGNRTKSHSTSQYIYNLAHQLIEDDAFSYTYDENGNLTSKIDKSTGKKIEYFYNVENQIVRVECSNRVQAEYYYDALGRRILKDINGKITKYLYDGHHIIAEYDQDEKMIARYLYGPNVDELLAIERIQEKSVFEIFPNALGTVKSFAILSGNFSKNRLMYNSFGNVISQDPTRKFNPFRFAGRELDDEVNLYYFRARYYDPQIGRFLQEDPAFVQSPQVSSYLGRRSCSTKRSATGLMKSLFLSADLHLYIYAMNNPIMYRDPFGERTFAQSFGNATCFCNCPDTASNAQFFVATPIPPNVALQCSCECEIDVFLPGEFAGPTFQAGDCHCGSV